MYPPICACRPPFLPFVKVRVEGEGGSGSGFPGEGGSGSSSGSSGDGGSGSSSGCPGEGGLAAGGGRLAVPRDSTSSEVRSRLEIERFDVFITE